MNLRDSRISLVLAIALFFLPISLVFADTLVTEIPVTPYPFGISVTPDGSKVVVAHNGLGDVISVISTADNSVLYTIPEGEAEWALAVSPNKAYVSNSGELVSVDLPSGQITARFSGSGSFVPCGLLLRGSELYSVGYDRVTVIDIANDAVLRTGPVSVGSYCAVLNQTGDKLYVSQGASGDTVTVLNSQTFSTLSTIVAGCCPRTMVLSDDGTKLYVSGDFFNEVKVIDTQTDTIVKSIPVRQDAMHLLNSPLTNEILVYSNGSEAAAISIIDSSIDAVSAIVDLGPPGFGGICQCMAVSPSGLTIYAVGLGSVFAVDYPSKTVRQQFTGLQPGPFVAAHPTNPTFYVTEQDSSRVAVFQA